MSIRKAIINLPSTLLVEGSVVKGTYKIPLYMKRIRSIYFYSTNVQYLNKSASNTQFNVNLKVSLNNFQTTPVNRDFALGYNDDDDYTKRDITINHDVESGQIMHYIAEFIHDTGKPNDPVTGGKICLIYDYENPNIPKTAIEIEKDIIKAQKKKDCCICNN